MKPISGVYYIIAIIGVIASVHTVQSQSAFEKRRSYITAGFGDGRVNLDTTFTGVLGHEGTRHYVPVIYKYEYAISKHLGLGFCGSYTWAKAYWGWNPYRYTEIGFIPHLSIHFGKSPKIDPYIGLGIGVNRIAYRLHSDNKIAEDQMRRTQYILAKEASVGVRFLFTKHFAGFIEGGVGQVFFQYGFVVKF